MSFKTLDPQPNFVELERTVQQYWQDKDILRKYLERNQNSKERFSFLDGPITANNPMGVHHAWGRTLKDLYQRFQNMQGKKQRFQNGFDCQGLWVEVEVEREKKFNSKKDIETFGVDNFTNACKSRVEKYANIQTEQSKRLGMFMDWGNSYYTNSETNNLYIWNFLKEIHEKGWLYKGKSSATWCPRCETGLSQHEQADGYKEITDISVYLKFKLKGRSNGYVLAWTTTPWTLSANVLLAINPSYEYVCAQVNGEKLYLAKQAAQRLGFEKYKEVGAHFLLGLEYESLYDIPAQRGVERKIVGWGLVDPKEGTGVVHIAPGCGQEDYELGLELGVAMISPLDTAGHFRQGYGSLTGKYAHDVSNEVIEYLKERKALYKTEPITHRYPHCWRCGTKCLFRLEDDWFISLAELRPQLKELVHKVHWVPEFAGKRMQDWLTNMGDWMISRKRYYGLSLPFYECGDCGELTVIGSKSELKERAVDAKKVDTLPSLHRPWLDEVMIKCPKCGKAVQRVPDVGDCWLDAGVAPFSTLRYFEDKKYWEAWYPAEFICEMVEQVRLWYYSMLVYGAVFENKVPYLNVLNYVEVRDENGERMSKTKKNGISFDDAVEAMGADVMRWLYVSQRPANNLNFGLTPGKEIRRRFFLILWNSVNYFVTFANLNQWEKKPLGKLEHTLDLWLVSRLNSLVEKVTKSLEKYQNHKAAEALENFVVNDLSGWYIRRSRGRTDEGFFATCHHVLYTLLTLLSPLTPHLAEWLYQVLGGNLDSVHLENWPKADKSLTDKKLEQEMQLVRDICEKGHAARREVGIKVRQPLSELVISCPSLPPYPPLPQLIEEELNVKKVIFKQGAVLEVALDTKITPQLELEGLAREFVREVQKARKEAKRQLQDKVVLEYPQEFEPVVAKFGKQIAKDTLVKEFKKGEKFNILV